MKFNHLVPKTEMMRKCKGEKQHYFVPNGHIEASIGHVAVRFECKNCGKIATSFLTFGEFKTNERIIRDYVYGGSK